MSCPHKKPCSCSDVALTTGTPCAQNTPDCPNPEPCSETFSGECIVYTGDTIVDFPITQGERFNEIIQKLIMLALNPTCINGSIPQQAVVGLMSTAVTASSITIKWLPTQQVIFYIVMYSTDNSTWTSVSTGTALLPNPSWTINNLLSNTDYYIKISPTFFVPHTCESLTILVHTKLT